MRRIILLLIIFMPNRIKIFMYNKLFKWDISKNAKIGFSFIDVRYASISDGVVIKSCTVIRNLDCLLLQENTRIGTLNWVIGKQNITVPIKKIKEDVRLYSVLKLEKDSAITNRHYIDCYAAVTIGAFSILAGIKTTLMTHSVDINESKQGAKEVIIGSYCFIGTDSTILGGTVLPDYCVVGAKSLLHKNFELSYSLYAGVPAKRIKSLPLTLPYFNRIKGFIS